MGNSPPDGFRRGRFAFNGLGELLEDPETVHPERLQHDRECTHVGLRRPVETLSTFHADRDQTCTTELR